ncbi:hypothetical protein BDV28DRAFT_129385 [Aspergillus coremiiformis]|uniref:Uncharacterized protein n=1 Tax=Aspergillus coremiiformis TaxID=138285 RepID=A0A5N6ZC70_9EURO|nr:hypothetical protein BDV28DRAFT_129385 [Aspergillus coremiiformis]
MPMMNTRRLDTDDEEHLDQSTREASSSSLSVSPSEQSASSSNKRRRSNQTYTASGVAFFALPAAGPHPNAAIQYYEDLPVQRTLDWQRDDHNQLMTREFTNNLSRLAAFVQTRGDEAPWPCSFCRDGLGVWQSCIIGSDTGHSSKIHGSCANCRFSRRYNIVGPRH